MYSLDDTIVAVSSPASAGRVIIRITGDTVVEILNKFFTPVIDFSSNSITTGQLRIEKNLEVDAACYLFTNGHSYTAEDLAELHFQSNRALTESVLKALLDCDLRLAAPGEFTARAYMNGRMDLAQAEAVNKVVTCGNRLQIAAAEKLLSGRLTDTTAAAADELLNIMSLLEAGMDFSEEDIDFITTDQAVERLQTVNDKLENLLSGSISLEAVLDLPSVGIAGSPNAGKSSLLNALLQTNRSIVSPQRKTTRDVLTGLLELDHNRCVLFDCPGLIAETHDQIDVIAQQAAVESLNTASVVLFCVDVTKQSLSEDITISALLSSGMIIGIAAKSDLIDQAVLDVKISQLRNNFKINFIPVSSTSGIGLNDLRKNIDNMITSHAVRDGCESASAGVALTARHKHSVSDAVDNIAGAIGELQDKNEDIAAMLIRGAYQSLGDLQQEHIDEKLLDNIFSEFCIGK